MSKERMQDLRRSLLNAGWEILNEKGDCRYPKDIYHVDDEIVVWGISNREGNKVLELEFHIFGELGRRSAELNDILYCVLKDQKLKLYFDKRNTEKWQKGLKNFVNSLQEE
jgi:hypothetical protein